jgi:hypothetical protein
MLFKVTPGDDVSPGVHLLPNRRQPIATGFTNSQIANIYRGLMVRALGLEPRTNALKGRCSTN